MRRTPCTPRHTPCREPNHRAAHEHRTQPLMNPCLRWSKNELKTWRKWVRKGRKLSLYVLLSVLFISRTVRYKDALPVVLSTFHLFEGASHPRRRLTAPDVQLRGWTFLSGWETMLADLSPPPIGGLAGSGSSQGIERALGGHEPATSQLHRRKHGRDPAADGRCDGHVWHSDGHGGGRLQGAGELLHDAGAGRFSRSQCPKAMMIL